MFQEFNAHVWNILLGACNHIICSLYERFQTEYLFCECRRELSCILSSIKESILGRYRARHAKFCREMALLLIKSASLRIIPWIRWNTGNHMLLAHPTLRANVRASLAVLARHGIRGDLALLIITKMMQSIQHAQTLLSQNCWDETYVAYETRLTAGIRT